MQFFVGIDVSLESSGICVIDERGVVIKEGTAPSEPEAIGRFCNAFARSFWVLA